MGAPPVQYVTTRDGYKIACFVAGTGRTIIRAPNIWNHVSRQWSSEVLGPEFEALSRRFRLVLYDTRGQGLSTRGLSESVSLDDYIADLEAVVERFGDGRFILDGWSFMAAVALKYAVDHPARIEAVVLRDYIDMSTRAASGAMAELSVQDWRMYIETTARTGWSRFDPAVITPILLDAMSQRDHILQTKAIRRVSGEALLQELRVPTLFLSGRTGSQPLTSEETSTRWAAILPSARLALFDEDGGAFSVAAIETIERFLAELEESATQGALTSRAAPPTGQRLSPRETEVLRLIAAGRSNQQIAGELVLSLRTVERHITNLYGKIGARGKADATAYALRHGLA